MLSARKSPAHRSSATRQSQLRPSASSGNPAEARSLTLSCQDLARRSGHVQDHWREVGGSASHRYDGRHVHIGPLQDCWISIEFRHILRSCDDRSSLKGHSTSTGYMSLFYHQRRVRCLLCQKPHPLCLCPSKQHVAAHLLGTATAQRCGPVSSYTSTWDRNERDNVPPAKLVLYDVSTRDRD